MGRLDSALFFGRDCSCRLIFGRRSQMANLGGEGRVELPGPAVVLVAFGGAPAVEAPARAADPHRRGPGSEARSSCAAMPVRPPARCRRPPAASSCLRHRLSVEQLEETSDMAPVWTVIAEAQGGTLFVLEDGTGEVLVDAASVFQLLESPAGDSPRMGDPGNVRIVEFLRGQGRDRGPPEPPPGLPSLGRAGGPARRCGAGPGHRARPRAPPAGRSARFAIASDGSGAPGGPARAAPHPACRIARGWTARACG